MLDQYEIVNGAAWRAVAGFTYKSPVETTSIVDIGSKLPLLGAVDISPHNADVPWFIHGIQGSRGQAAGRRL